MHHKYTRPPTRSGRGHSVVARPNESAAPASTSNLARVAKQATAKTGRGRSCERAALAHVQSVRVESQLETRCNDETKRREGNRKPEDRGGTPRQDRSGTPSLYASEADGPDDQTESSGLIDVDFAANEAPRQSGEGAEYGLHDLERRTCERATRDAIFKYVPAAHSDLVVRRFVVYALWPTWRDEETGRRIICVSILAWIWGKPLGHGTAGRDVLKHIRSVLPNLEWTESFSSSSPDQRNRCRSIKEDGLPPKLWSIAQEDTERGLRKRQEPVYAISGAAYDAQSDASATRRCLTNAVEPIYAAAPSDTALYICQRMNARASNLFAKMLTHMEEAREQIRSLDIDIDSNQMSEAHRSEVAERIREEYSNVLDLIEHQHKPFYQFSRRGRTDRIFPLNKSVLSLPRRVREVICQDFVSIDLRSAHLCIAASLCAADTALTELLRPDYSIWDDLMRHLDADHLQKGDEEYSDLKAALKAAVYNLVYGMKQSSLKGAFTKATKSLLQPDTRAGLLDHPVLRDLLDKRERAIEDLVLNDRLHTPTGISVRDDLHTDPLSMLATIAQSYEQSLMKVILEYEEQHARSQKQYFHVVLWLHDGCYVSFTRRRDRENLGNAHVKELRKRLSARADELGVPAFLEVERLGT